MKINHNDGNGEQEITSFGEAERIYVNRDDGNGEQLVFEAVTYPVVIDSFEDTSTSAGWSTETNVSRVSATDAIDGSRVAQFDPNTTGFLFGDSSGLPIVPGYEKEPLTFYLRGEPSIYSNSFTIDLAETVDTNNEIVDGYRLQIAADSNNWDLYRVDGGVSTELDAGWVDTTSGEWITVEWVFNENGHTISLAASGNSTMSSTDTTHTSINALRISSTSTSSSNYMEVDNIHVGEEDTSPSGYDVHETFDDSSWTDTFGDHATNYSGASVVDTTGRSGNQLEGHIDSTSNKAFETYHDMNANHGHRPTAAYCRFWMRFEPGFQNNATWDGKLPGFAGYDPDDPEGSAGNPSTGTAWSARMGHDARVSGDIQLEFYTYHMDQPGTYGEHLVWDQQAQEDQWYDIEQYIELGTPNTNDGILRAWMDGTRVFNKEDMRWRDSSGNDIKTLWWICMHGGSETPDDSIYMQFDDLYVTLDGMPPE